MNPGSLICSPTPNSIWLGIGWSSSAISHTRVWSRGVSRDSDGADAESDRHVKRPVQAVVADAQKAGVYGILAPFLEIAEELGLPREGFLHGIMITPPENRSRYLVWIDVRNKRGRARVEFDYEQLALRSGMPEAELRSRYRRATMTPSRLSDWLACSADCSRNPADI